MDDQNVFLRGDDFWKNVTLIVLVILLCATIGWAMLERSNRQHIEVNSASNAAELARCDDRLREISQEAAKPDAPPQEAAAPTPHVGP